MRVVVVGGGIAGLASALALARDGHSVTVLERDATPMPESADGAFDWQRRGAPQVRHSHAFLARLRNQLVERAPDVLTALLAAGATEQRFCDNLPDTLTDTTPMPGDDELVAIACRRTTFEWVLRRTVLAIDAVEFRDGVAVDGLLCDADSDDNDDAPRVVGVRTNVGAITADLVIDASGPRTASHDWLAAIGVVEPDEESLDSEIVYLSRFYRLRDGVDAPEARGPVGGDLGYLKYAVFIGDNHTFSVTLAVDVHDRALRSSVSRVDGFEAAAAQLAAAQDWLDGRSEPITEVHVMAGLRNRKRTFVVDGAPVVRGFAAVGDAAVCTNPLYGRGCSLAVVHAFELADALSAHAGDQRAFAMAFEASTERELDPWFRAAVQQDREAIAAAQSSRDVASSQSNGAVADAEGFVDPRAWAREIFRDGLMPAVRTSPVVFRAFLRWFNLLANPDALMNDGAVIAAALASYEDRDNRPPEPVLGPPLRADFIAALGGSPRSVAE